MADKYFADYRIFAWIGTAVGEIVVPVLVGIGLDHRFGWSPIGLAGGSVIGVVGGTIHLFWLSRRWDQTTDPDNATSGPNGSGSQQ